MATAKKPYYKRPFGTVSWLNLLILIALFVLLLYPPWRMKLFEWCETTALYWNSQVEHFLHPELIKTR
ncbi:MAG: hypothetical protein HYU64_07515 [Armatimonadetes bacterium]|nr:hypothetical protein [Armatimonadota bacterium]